MEQTKYIKARIARSGFVQQIYCEVYQVQLPRTSQNMSLQVKKVRTGQRKTGDLVFFSTKNHVVTHVGIYLKDNKFIHASSIHCVTISNLNASYYQHRLAFIGRHQVFMPMEQNHALHTLDGLSPMKLTVSYGMENKIMPYFRDNQLDFKDFITRITSGKIRY